MSIRELPYYFYRRSEKGDIKIQIQVQGVSKERVYEILERIRILPDPTNSNDLILRNIIEQPREAYLEIVSVDKGDMPKLHYENIVRTTNDQDPRS